MKNTRNLFLSLLAGIMTMSAALAQQNTITWGQELKWDRKSSLLKTLGKDSKYIFILKEHRKYILSSSKSDLLVMKYDANTMNLLNEVPLKFNNIKTDKKQNFEGIYVCKNKRLLFSSFYDKDTKINTAYAQQLDENYNVAGEQVKIDEIQGQSKMKSGSYSIILSNDSTKFLVVNNPPYDKYNNEKFHFKVYSNDLKLLSSRDIVLPYLDKKFSTEEYELADDGTIYMLARIDLDRKEREKGDAKYYMNVLAIQPDEGGTVKEFELKLDKKRLSNVHFKQDVAGNALLCAGYYTDLTKDDYYYHGLFYFKINNKTKEVESQLFKEFKTIFNEDFIAKKVFDKGRGLDLRYEIKDIVRRDDGGVYIVSEYTHDYSITTTDSKGFTRTTNHYERGNILVFNMDAKGDLARYSLIKKAQHTVNDGGFYLSYALQLINNKLYFIYNDHPKNLLPSPKKIRTMSNPRRSLAFLTEVDESGNVNKLFFQKTKENKFIILPQFLEKISSNEAFIFSFQSNGTFLNFAPPKLKMGKLSI